MEASHLGLNVSKASHSLAVGLHICSHLVQEEVSLMMADQGTDLIIASIIRIYFITTFF